MREDNEQEAPAGVAAAVVTLRLCQWEFAVPVELRLLAG